MLFIPVVWTEYTAVVDGRVLKLVPCEHCATEYVYVLERSAMGCGKSFYLLNEEGAAEQAKVGAEEALRSYLENDYDPVPCPVCGHYQRHMFPKLYDGGSGLVQAAQAIAMVGGCVDIVGVVYWILMYFQSWGNQGLVGLAVTLGLLPVLALTFFALSAAERSRARRFDPNIEDQQARIAKGRSRAVTRAEFTESQQRERNTGTADPGAPPVKK